MILSLRQHFSTEENILYSRIILSISSCMSDLLRYRSFISTFFFFLTIWWTSKILSVRRWPVSAYGLSKRSRVSVGPSEPAGHLCVPQMVPRDRQQRAPVRFRLRDVQQWLRDAPNRLSSSDHHHSAPHGVLWWELLPFIFIGFMSR